MNKDTMRAARRNRRVRTTSSMSYKLQQVSTQYSREMSTRATTIQSISVTTCHRATITKAYLSMKSLARLKVKSQSIGTYPISKIIQHLEIRRRMEQT